MSTWFSPTLSLVSGFFLLFYYLFVFLSHYRTRGIVCALAEHLWACNIAIFLAAIGMFLHSISIISAAVTMTSMAHCLWIIDATAWLITGHFPLGNAKYLAWRSSNIVEILSTLHHVWFIPLCFINLYGNGALIKDGFVMAFLLSASLGLLCRLITPKTFTYQKKCHYLNINMSYEMWPDIKHWTAHLFDPPKYSWFVYFPYGIIYLNFLNGFFYFLLLLLSERLLHRLT